VLSNVGWLVLLLLLQTTTKPHHTTNLSRFLSALDYFLHQVNRQLV
jgi:hypothetical protein